MAKISPQTRTGRTPATDTIHTRPRTVRDTGQSAQTAAFMNWQTEFSLPNPLTATPGTVLPVASTELPPWNGKVQHIQDCKLRFEHLVNACFKRFLSGIGQAIARACSVITQKRPSRWPVQKWADSFKIEQPQIAFVLAH